MKKHQRWLLLFLVVLPTFVFVEFFKAERLVSTTQDQSPSLVRSYLTEASPDVWLALYRNRNKRHLADLECKAPGVKHLRQKCWKPRVPCLGIIVHDGAGPGVYKSLCNLWLMKRLTNSRPLVYSMGSNDQWEFEEFIYNFFDQTPDIHTFSIEKAGENKPHWLRYHQVAIGSKKNLTLLHQELGYAGKPIHLLKIDVEGFEQLLLADLFGPDGKTCMLEIWHLNMETHSDTKYVFGGYPNLPYKIKLQAQHEKQLSEVCGLEKFHQETPDAIVEHAYIKIDWADVTKQISNERNNAN